MTTTAITMRLLATGTVGRALDAAAGAGGKQGDQISLTPIELGAGWELIVADPAAARAAVLAAWLAHDRDDRDAVLRAAAELGIPAAELEAGSARPERYWWFSIGEPTHRLTTTEVLASAMSEHPDLHGRERHEFLRQVATALVAFGSTAEMEFAIGLSPGPAGLVWQIQPASDVT